MDFHTKNTGLMVKDCRNSKNTTKLFAVPTTKQNAVEVFQCYANEKRIIS